MGWTEVNTELGNRATAISAAETALATVITQIATAKSATQSAINQVPSGLRRKITGAQHIYGGDEVAHAFVSKLAAAIGVTFAESNAGASTNLATKLAAESSTILAAQ